MRPSRRGGAECARSCRPCSAPLLFTSHLSPALTQRRLSALCQIRARIPWQSGNLPLAQAKRRFYRPKRQPLGNLANCLSNPKLRPIMRPRSHPPKTPLLKDQGRRPYGLVAPLNALLPERVIRRRLRGRWTPHGSPMKRHSPSEALNVCAVDFSAPACDAAQLLIPRSLDPSIPRLSPLSAQRPLRLSKSSTQKP